MKLSIVVLLAATIGAFAASAQAQQGSMPPAPSFHQPTGLSFPARIGGAQQLRSVDYAKLAGDARLGFSWLYQLDTMLVGTVYVYTGGQRVPDGANNAMVRAQFDQALNDITVAAVMAKRYSDLRPVGQPSICRYGAMEFWCLTQTAITGAGVPVYTRLLVGGLRGHFVKLRLDWQRNVPAADAEAERFQQILFGAVVR